MSDLACTWLGLMATIFGLGTVLLRSPVHSALSLVMVVFHVAGLFVLMGAGFLAALQVIVYAGAIIVLFLFTMMLLNLEQHDNEPHMHRYQKWLGFPLGGALLIEATWIALAQANPPETLLGKYSPERLSELGGTAFGIADAMFTSYLLPFEVAGVLLLAASVAALSLARKSDEDNLGAMPDMVSDAAGSMIQPSVQDSKSGQLSQEHGDDH